ncbi:MULTISPECIES: potassium-transporting ATPase subunit KdpC [unclassified Microbacterium]|uniref:potassium-transporting ATPase subunit KdpC n=1 Tax=unclassified Microbacterium TaxID=2609290 RepID=UPI0012F984C1|nr:potassium-transporting ATPase subunit KdpC [Microbacterium sp. MAH-37]MVQ41530.1 potassium-transporting ATPase subunit KdpC [Microbacterium sp. MAH-37]
MSNLRTTARTGGVALRAVLVMTVLLGIVYPLVVTGIGQIAFPWQANGSVVSSGGKDVGSALLGQSFADEDGDPLPQYFQPRPAAGGYDPTASGGSNLGPSNPDLVKQIEERRAQIAAFEHVAPSQIPADALTASSSGLDSHISPVYALLQVPRVAAERDMREDDVRAIVESHIQEPDLGFLGEERVNVLELNIALDAASGDSR